MMKNYLFIFLLSIPPFSSKAPPVTSGKVVPFQELFMEINRPMWVVRAAQVWVESDFNPKAASKSSTAKGLAQFLHPTWVAWGVKGASPFDPKSALISQNKYMCYLEAQTGGLNSGIGSYYVGISKVLRAQYIAKNLGLKDQDAWIRMLPRLHTNPSRTKAYIAKNLQRRTWIQTLLKNKSSIA
jgi:hypothetical protein